MKNCWEEGQGTSKNEDVKKNSRKSLEIKSFKKGRKYEGIYFETGNKIEGKKKKMHPARKRENILC